MTLYKIILSIGYNFSEDFEFLVVAKDLQSAVDLTVTTYNTYNQGNCMFKKAELLAGEGQYTKPNILLLPPEVTKQFKEIAVEDKVCPQCGKGLQQDESHVIPICNDCDLLTTGVSKEIYNVAEAMVLSGYVHHRYLDIPRESDNERYKNWQKLQIGGICYTLAHAKLKAKELNINF